MRKTYQRMEPHDIILNTKYFFLSFPRVQTAVTAILDYYRKWQ